MLVRALIIVDNAKLERRLDCIFEPLETAVATAPHEAVLWDRVKAFPADLVVIGRASLPDPIEDTVETIQALPDARKSSWSARTRTRKNVPAC